MATVSITGTLQDASGVAAEDVPIRLEPAPASASAAEAMSGIGIVLSPVETLTAANGTFSLNAVQGYRYRLLIEAIGFDREFVAPAVGSIQFHLLGLKPFIEEVAHGEDADGDTQVFVTVEVAAEATVRERYDKIVLESGTALAGPFTSLTEIDLLADKAFYTYNDTPASSAVFYRSRYKNTAAVVYSEYSEVRSAAEASEESLLLGVDELKTLYLFGADLTDDEGNPFPRRIFEHYIAAATDWLSKELDIPLVAHNYTGETYDHYRKDYGAWGYIQLDHYPVIEVTKLAFQYPSMATEVEYDPQWVVLEDEGASGVIQIVPGQGSIADVLLIPGSIMPLWSGATGRIPSIWHVDYRAGFEVGTLPPDLKHVIGMHAAIGVLNIAGDLIAGAGIATKSVSVPGLNQNI
ncbi:MAG: carboxypeptidase-like regulatory domain-containing protein, partial [Spirochaetes bacterium]|nr:carboxypeptidase-like regulatory domain-containing protein [Spirochaetota bacterium]